MSIPRDLYEVACAEGLRHLLWRAGDGYSEDYEAAPPDWWSPMDLPPMLDSDADRARAVAVAAGWLLDLAGADDPLCKGEARHPAGASTTTPPEGATPPSGPVPCPATGYGWTCARPADHDGPHVRCGLADATACARWTDAAEAAEPAPDAEVATWCPQCGPACPVDEDGCCEWCGATAMGEGADEAAGLRARLADAELRVALWSGASVEGWERGGGGRYVRSRGVLAVYLTFPVNEGDPWGWEATCRGRTVADGSDLDPLVCLRAAEAWLSEVPRG